MKRISEPFVQQICERDGQRGQALILAASLLIAFFVAAAISIDFGLVYFAYEQLLSATDAAALAGGTAIPNGNAITVAAQYSALTGDNNTHPSLTNVTQTATLECLTSSGLPNCLVFGSQPSANAIVVTQKATVPTFFAKIFGVNSLNISATATASAKGGGSRPYNVMMVLDTTPSMRTADTDCAVPGISNPTREDCAEYGMRTLLSELDPCPSGNPACVTAGDLNGDANVANAVDEVGLMVFPGLPPSEATTLNNPPIPSPEAPDEYACGSGRTPITVASYNDNPGYLIIPLGSNYRASNSSTMLNPSSNIAVSLGAGTGACSGLSLHVSPAAGTFYAGAIASAQNYLTANTRTNVPNVMILLSDGDATANGPGDMAGTVPGYTDTAPCQQAVNAATTAKNAGILIYSVAYGAEVTGCSNGDTLTPCQTMEQIASAPISTYFFSDYNQSGGGIATNCVGRDKANLNQIFTDIGADLTTARLLPNNTP